MTWTAQTQGHGSLLAGVRVLVVDDEAVIALEIEYMLTEAGASVAGPAANVEEALALVRTEDLSAAVLDVRLGNENVTPVAEALSEQGVPFIFYSGQTRGDITLFRWPEAVFVAKPAPARALTDAVRKVLSAHRGKQPAEAAGASPAC